MSVGRHASLPRAPRRWPGRAAAPATPAALIVVLSVLFLGACAPSAAGTSGSAPIRAGAAPVPVQQGTTYYLRFDQDPAMYDLGPRDLTAPLWVPSGYASEVGDVTVMFALHDARVAADWKVELLQVKVERRTVVSDVSFGEPRVEYSLWAVVKVVVPTGIVPGPYRLRGTLQARSGKTAPVAATLQVLPQ